MSNTSIEREAFKPDEVAVRLGVSLPTVYRWLGSGDLKSFVIGRGRRVTRAALEEFIAKRSQVPA